MRAADDPLDVRLIYDDTPGIARIQRTHASTMTGTADPAGDGTLHPHAMRGYAIGAGVVVGLPIDADDGLDALLGADLCDGIARGQLPSAGAPGGATASREDLDAFALRLRGGVSWRFGDFRVEAAPFAAIGVARATFEGTQVPSGSGGNSWGCSRSSGSVARCARAPASPTPPAWRRAWTTRRRRTACSPSPRTAAKQASTRQWRPSPMISLAAPPTA